LLVEDDPHVSLTIENLLTAIGHQCISVNNGIEALEALDERTDIELVITDYQMPKLNGSELVNRLRSKGLQIPIIILSGYGASVNLHQDYQPNAILGKPVQLKKLSEVILTVMNEYSNIESGTESDG
jgi:CheY-like chemotaxis protein